MNSLRFFAVLVLMPVCSCDSAAQRGEVRGRVTLDGEPVVGSTIAFENAAQGIAATATLEDDGTYEVKMIEGPGLPVGTYQVSIYPGRMMRSTDEIPLAGKNPQKAIPAVKSPIPAHYHKAATSKLTIEVKKQNEPFNFALVK